MTVKTKLILNIIAIAAVIAIGARIGSSYWKKHEHPGVNYKEIPVARETIEAMVLATGTVQPENRLDIKAPIAGRAEKILVREGDHVTPGQIVAWMSSTERAALLDAARAEGPEAVKYWEDLYQPTPILAPLEGTIIQRNIEAGQTFQNTDPILVESNRLVVKAQVDETDIAQVKMNMATEIRLDAYPQNPIRAHVVHIAFDAKVISSVTTYVVDVLPDKQPDFMRSGMTANVKFYVDRHPNVLTIPVEAVKTLEGGATVVTMHAPPPPPNTPEPTNQNGPSVIQHAVKLGLTDGKRVEVVAGLTDKDVVLTPEKKPLDHSKSGASPFTPMSGGGGKSQSVEAGVGL